MAWAEPPATYGVADSKSQTVKIHEGKNDSLKGTLYNQFYKPNPEASPMKPLPKNLDK